MLRDNAAQEPPRAKVTHCSSSINSCAVTTQSPAWKSKLDFFFSSVLRKVERVTSRERSVSRNALSTKQIYKTLL